MIYRYIDSNLKKLATVKRNQIWMSSPEDFNDPFDCNFPIMDNFSAEDFEKIMELGGKRLCKSPPEREVFLSATENDKRRFIQNCVAEFRSRIASFGVCCFSEVWNSILMWSHYADKHQGICLGYENKGFEEQHPGVLNKVRYSTHYPDVRLGQIHRDFNRMLEIYLLTKSVDWRYEREWRLIITEEACRKRVPSQLPLKEVIFGVKIDPNRRDCMLKNIDTRIDCYDAIHEPIGEYGLTRRKISAGG